MAEAEQPQNSESGPPGPFVLAINICDMVIRDELTHKVSLIGLFGVIQARGFPCVHGLMHIYVALTGGHGRQMIEVRLVRAADDQKIVAMTGPVEFVSPLQVAEIALQWRDIPFEMPGKYFMEVCCASDSVPLASRTVNVVQMGQPLPPSGSEG